MWPSWKKSLPSPQPKGVLIKTSLVDYPERVAAAYFLLGCNLRCPYCYNTELVEPSAQDKIEFVSVDEVLSHLKRRANVLTGFVISGGEPLCHPQTVKELILRSRSLGYKIKLDTNGMFPDRLKELLDDKDAAPDYIALDVKTRPWRYKELNGQDGEQKILESIKIVSALLPSAREFRTVLYPPLASAAEIEELASLLPKDARWRFAHFLNGRCLSAAAQSVQAYAETEENALVEIARKKIPGASLR